MDRVLKVYSRPGCLFAELAFHYDRPDSVTASLSTHRAYETGEGDDVSYSTYPSMTYQVDAPFRRFRSLAEAKTHDWELVRRYAGHEIEPGLNYTYGYDDHPVLERYVLEDHRGCEAMIDIRYNLAGDVKTMAYRSAEHPRKDWDVNGTPIDSNWDLMSQVPIINYEGEIGHINPNHLRRLDPWY